MINITEKSNCCGCSACVQRCPRQCITLKEDEEGFLYPHIDKNNCIECNLCEKVCPLINSSEKILPIQVVAAKNRNEEERLDSSSGGVFIALAKYVISKGGVVFGAVFDEKWEVKHTYTETIEGIRPMMGSKYLQSRIENTFSEAEQFLKQGRKVMFTGTPCQITGLKRYLKIEYDNLLTVDFLCHGTPSPGVWRKYVKDVYNSIFVKAVKNINSKPFLKDVRLDISSISFRDKSLHGWENYNFTVKGKFNINSYQDDVILTHMHNNDPFMKGFLSNIYLRPCCYNCKCKNGVSQSDVTIADFWGIKNIMPDFDDDKGISLVMLNTNIGAKNFDKLDLDVRVSSIEDAKRFNGGFKNNVTIPIKNRYLFFNYYSNCDIPFQLMINGSIKVSLHEKIYNILRHLKRKFIK